MRGRAKPIVVASRCLGFDHCRWNAQIISNAFVKQLKDFAIYKTVCPEVEIGLGVPRNPVRVVDIDGARRLMQPATGNDITERMTSFSNKFLDSVKEVDGFLLKGGSPSCRIKNTKIYRGVNDTAIKKKGSGLFGNAVMGRFGDIAVEDEEKLSNLAIREHFLTKLFTISSFKEVKTSKCIMELIRFQTENKFLLMVYNEKEMRIMGKIVADRKARGFEETIDDYQKHLYSALSEPKDRGDGKRIDAHDGIFQGSKEGRKKILFKFPPSP